MLPPLKKEYIWLIKITLKRKDDPSTTTTAWVSDKSYIEGDLYSNSPDVYGNLLEISGFGHTMGEVLPSAQTGNISINNTRGTFKYNTRFSDFLQNYSVVQAGVEFYLLPKIVDELADSGDLILLSKSKIQDVSVDWEANIVYLSVEGESLSTDRVGFKISEQDFSFAPSRSIGKTLPVVFGEDVQVKGFPVTDETVTGASEDTEYLFASGFSPVFKNGGFKKFLIKSRNDEYVEFTPGMPFTGSITGLTGATTISDFEVVNWSGLKEKGFLLKPGQNVSIGHTLVGAQYVFEGDAADGNFTEIPGKGFQVNVYEAATDGFPGKKVTSSFNEIIRSNDNIVYDSFKEDGLGTSHHLYRFSFPFLDAVVIDRSYFVTLQRNINNDGSWGVVHNNRTPSSIATFQEFQKWDTGSSSYDEAVNSPEWQFVEKDESKIAFSQYAIYSLAGNNVSGDSFGRSYSSLNLFKLFTSSSVPNINDLDLIGVIDGLEDADDGRITGAANSLIRNPAHAVRLLYTIQNGNSTSGLDTGTSVSNLSDFEIHGKTEPGDSFRDAIKGILSEYSMKMFPEIGGNLKLWAFNQSETIDHRVDESDIQLLEANITGRDSIVNEVSFSFDKSEVPIKLQDLQQDINTPNGFSQSRFYAVGESNIADLLVSRSVDLYGRLPARNDFQRLNYVNDPAVTDRIANYIFSWYSFENYIFRVTVPVLKNRFYNVSLFDIIFVSHPDNFNENGGEPDGVAKLPFLNGSELTEFNFRYPWRKAKGYLFRVLSYDPKFTDRDNESELVLTLKLLTNQEKQKVLGN